MGRGREHLRVFVFGSEEAMMAGARRLGFVFPGRFHAGCLTRTPGRDGHCGDLFFSREHLSPGVIAHEVTHAAIALAAERRWNLGEFAGGGAAGRQEESFRAVIESLVDQCFAGCAWHDIAVPAGGGRQLLAA